MALSSNTDGVFSRYEKFVEHMSDSKAEVIRVFDPLSKKQLEELELIREVSRELQKKKDEDMRKISAQSTNEAEPEKKPDEVKPEAPAQTT